MGLPFLLCRAFVQSAASKFEQNEIPQWSFVVNIFRARLVCSVCLLAFSVGALCAQECISHVAPTGQCCFMPPKTGLARLYQGLVSLSTAD
jgi:hypothetical protein